MPSNVKNAYVCVLIQDVNWKYYTHVELLSFFTILVKKYLV